LEQLYGDRLEHALKVEGFKLKSAYTRVEEAPGDLEQQRTLECMQLPDAERCEVKVQGTLVSAAQRRMGVRKSFIRS